MSHILIVRSPHREVAVHITGTTVSIDHHYLTVDIRFPPRHALNMQSRWIDFFARKFVDGQFVFAGAVAGYIVSRFLTSAEVFAVWDAVRDLPHSVTQCTTGFCSARAKHELVTATYHYEERKLTVTKDIGSFGLEAILPAEAAFPFGVTWAQ